jgi:site-specific recombinase XerD
MDNHDKSIHEDDGYERVSDRVRIFQRGQTWYANFQHNKKQKRVSLKTISKKEARRRALRIDAQLEGGRWETEIKPAALPEVIASYMSFLRAEGRSKKTIVKYEHVYKRVAELAEERRVISIAGLSLKFFDAYRRLRNEEKAASKTIYTESVIIRQLVNFALSREMLAKDPMKGVKLKKPRPTAQPCWTFGELQRILDASPDEAKAAFILLAETGMRFGELQWLTWNDVDVAKNIMRIRPKDGWKPKTGDERAIPISPAARKVLESLPRRWPWVVTMPPSPTVLQEGRQWTERRLLATLKRVLARLQLPGKLHTFRHAFISNALVNGVPPAVVQEWVGHVDPAIIKMYTHVHNDASQTAMQRLNEVNDRLQKKEEKANGTESGSAQIQHKEEQ